MPKVAYSEEERRKIRNALVSTALDLIVKQGIQHTTVEQIYTQVGISRTFFYSFFSTKEDLIIEALYLQQPKVVAYAKKLMDSTADWWEAVSKFLYSCCYGGEHGIVVLTIEEQQLVFRRLSPKSYEMFRAKQAALFGKILECFGIKADMQRINLFINLSLTAIVVCRAIPDTLPLFVPEAAKETVAVQIDAIITCLEKMKEDT